MDSTKVGILYNLFKLLVLDMLPEDYLTLCLNFDGSGGLSDIDGGMKMYWNSLEEGIKILGEMTNILIL